MFIGHFTERPYQDPNSGYFGATGRSLMDLGMSNASYDPRLGADLYNRYLDERVFAEEMGFDGLMLNEHHSTPFCMGGVMNVEARDPGAASPSAKIVLLGNILPIWDDPLWLAEELAEIDMISRGPAGDWLGARHGPGERGTQRPVRPYNWERFQEAHDFIVKAWTKPGPWRWEGEHYQFRYVNPVGAALPGSAPADLDPGHPEHGTPSIGRRSIATRTSCWRRTWSPRKKSFEYYDEQAPRKRGYEAGTAAPRLPVQGARGRDRRTRRRGGPQVRPGAQQPLPGGQPGHGAQQRSCRTCRA